MPIRHGLTIGELARLFNGERKIGAKLTVVQMPRWRRDWWFDDTGAPWINPSPNMRSLTQATPTPASAPSSSSNISVGRGTDTPFEQIGAPWIDGLALAAALNARDIPGVRAYPIRFTPASSVYAGQACGGVSFIVTDREALRPTRSASRSRRRWRASIPRTTLKPDDRLVGAKATTARILGGEDPPRSSRPGPPTKPGGACSARSTHLHPGMIRATPEWSADDSGVVRDDSGWL